MLLVNPPPCGVERNDSSSHKSKTAGESRHEKNAGELNGTPSIPTISWNSLFEGAVRLPPLVIPLALQQLKKIALSRCGRRLPRRKLAIFCANYFVRYNGAVPANGEERTFPTIGGKHETAG
jgi:hypothetical protein